MRIDLELIISPNNVQTHYTHVHYFQLSEKLFGVYDNKQANESVVIVRRELLRFHYFELSNALAVTVSFDN